MNFSVDFILGCHCHQPVGNFLHVFQEAYDKAYLPFVEKLSQHPGIKCVLHYSGPLLDWFQDNKPEFLDKVRALVQRGQVEVMSGGYYEPIPMAIPARDLVEQIEKMNGVVQRLFGVEPVGMWLAERIWEPHLAKPIAEANIKYTVVDDNHFKYAGLSQEELYGYYVTEEEGHKLSIFPISERLRYTVPFHPVEETIGYLRDAAQGGDGRLLVLHDDGEKFGTWPGTYKSVYEEGWLERFFCAIEANKEWLNLCTYAEFIQRRKPMGRAYLPIASYKEMMEWALPPKARAEFNEADQFVVERFGSGSNHKYYLRAGIWRNFLTKYPESNNMHKKMLSVSEKLEGMTHELAHEPSRPDQVQTTKLAQAREALFRGQCNCGYWHGIFGGLYLNHLRAAIYNNLIAADRLLDEIRHAGRPEWLEVSLRDFDCDGMDDVIIANRHLTLLFDPYRGGSLFELDVKEKDFNLLDTLSRRPEAYHRKIIEASRTGSDAARSIHELSLVKEAGLENLLVYDSYRKSSFIDHFFAPGTDPQSFEKTRYTESGDFVSMPFTFQVKQQDSMARVAFLREGRIVQNGKRHNLRLLKTAKLNASEPCFEVLYEIENLSRDTAEIHFGTELNLTLLAGDATDRYYFVEGSSLDDRRLKSRGVVDKVDSFGLRDDWQKMAVHLRWDNPATVWRFPIETVSQSEAGQERTYQHSCVVPNWHFTLQPGGTWRTKISLEVEAWA